MTGLLKKAGSAAALLVFAVGCGASEQNVSQESVRQQTLPAAPRGDDARTTEVETIAEDFVKLALGAGVHDAAFVDAYHGPEDWADAAKEASVPLDALEVEAQRLLIAISRLNADAQTVRTGMLEKLIRAALARIQIAQGEEFPFNEETRLLYDAVAPDYDIAEFDAALARIDEIVPGAGPLSERVDAFRDSLAIPKDKLGAVFNAAIDECRARTLKRYDLPQSERFTLEFVTDKPWSGYNWYQGGFHSLIEVNTDFPIIIDRAVDLGCHEGYPGHHTWNAILERDLVKGKGWIEYSVYPLFSPLSLTAEGTANYGIELAFPGDEKIAFERDVLFAIAGLDPDDAARLAALNEARRKLSHARNHVAREYLDGRIDRDTAITWLATYGLQSRERAEQGVRFIETYRGYVLNYNLGRDLVADFIDRHISEGRDQWDVFETLLVTPMSASEIAAAQ